MTARREGKRQWSPDLRAVWLAASLWATAGCEAVRQLELVPSLPTPCTATSVNELQVRGLGDFPPPPAQIAALGADAAVLSLPLGTRVVSVEGTGTGGFSTFGRSAPLDLPAVWQGPRRIGIAYGPPDTMCDTAKLAYARSGHHATLLVDGSVLLSGGIDHDGNAVVALERYLPTGDDESSIARFEPIGSGASAATINQRAVLGHDATRLGDGRVLITGGAPARTGDAHEGALFLATDGSLMGPERVLAAGPRAYHSNVVLADGRVLVTGGCSALEAGVCVADTALDSTEIYDPTTDTFTQGISLLAARSGHTALLRDDGLVVIVGGRGSDGVALPPELYDPDEAGGATLSGPTGSAVAAASGLVIALDDAAGPSVNTVDWSARDDAPAALPQLPSARDGATLTALEDGAVIVIGGGDATTLAPTSVVLSADGAAVEVPGFSARGHTATRLLDGSVLVAGGGDAEGQASSHAALFLRSMVGPFSTPATITFDGTLGLTPNQPGRVRVQDGVLVVDAGTQTGSTPAAFALLAGPETAGPNGAGFTLNLLAGTDGAGEVAILFGDPASARYVWLDLVVGAPPRIVSVRRDRPGLLTVEPQSGCDASALDADDLPDGDFAAWVIRARNGRVELARDGHVVLGCSTSASTWPVRGGIALGAVSGRVRYDNLQLER